LKYKIVMFIEIFWVVLILFIWFNTDAFIQYSKLFKLDKKFKISDWESYRIDVSGKISYQEYLSLKHKGFLTKLISCKPCLTFWVTFLVCFLFSSLYYFPVIYIISYLIYKIINKYE
jgi:hypothetical protein